MSYSSSPIVNPSSGTASGQLVAVDVISGTILQLMKLTYGAEGSSTAVTTSTPFPIQIRNSSGTELGTSSAPLRIDPTGTTAQPVNFASTPTIILSGTGAVNLSQYNGSAVGATNGVHVQPGTGTIWVGGFSGPQLVLQSGNWSVRNLDGTGAALASSTSNPSGSEQALIVRNIPSGTQAVSLSGGIGIGSSVANGMMVQGPVASGVTAAGNPIQVGLVGQSSPPSLVLAGQLVQALADLQGRQVMVPHQVREACTDAYIAITNSVTETTLLSSGGAGILWDMVAIKIDNAGAVDAIAILRDTVGGSTRSAMFIKAGSANGIAFPTPLRQATANTAWTVQSTASTSSLLVTAEFVKNR